jgi:hypothetical protein
MPQRCNLVDLATRISETPFIFEMKSTGATNIRSQVRRGISQLYEYRYLQNAPDAKLVLVIEKPFAKEDAWMHDYLVRDLGILLAWDGDRKHLHCSESQREFLDFLVA